MDIWPTYKLEQICDYTHNRTSDVKNYISTENMQPGKGGICPAAKAPADAAIEYRPGDILISNIRPYFQKIWYADRNGGCSADVLCIRAKENADSRYLYYLLSQQAFFDYVMSGAKGCKMPRGDKKQIMQWPVNLPPLATQQRIAAILGALDDKIELNRRINANLEEQARALFKSWFVENSRSTDKIGTLRELILAIVGGDWGQEASQGNYTHRVYCIRGTDIPTLKQGAKGKMPTRYILDFSRFNLTN